MSGCNGVMASATQKNSVEDVRAAESIGEEVAMSPGREQGESGDTSVQTLVGNGMSKVPARFIRTESELISFTPHTTMSLEPIPMIDLEGLHDYRRQFTMAAISSACRHWGCFQIVNHDIPQSTLDDALRAAREFFAMPAKEKQKHASSCYGIQSVETKDEVLDWGDIMFHKNMESWPTKPAGYKAAMLAYTKETTKVLERLLDVVSVEHRLAPTYFRDLFGEPKQTLRVNYYPPCPQPELVLGLHNHTDPVVFTALLEDQTRGLQVKNGDNWVTVDPEPDAVVVFVGDQLQVASNGRCQAVSHRAVVNKDTDRISIAMGMAPNPKVVVRPAPELPEKGSPGRSEARTIKAALPHGVRW